MYVRTNRQGRSFKIAQLNMEDKWNREQWKEIPKKVLWIVSKIQEIGGNQIKETKIIHPFSHHQISPLRMIRRLKQQGSKVIRSTTIQHTHVFSM